MIGYDLDGVLAEGPAPAAKKWGEMNGPERAARKAYLARHYRSAAPVTIPSEPEFAVISARKGDEPEVVKATSEWLMEHYAGRVRVVELFRGSRSIEAVAQFKAEAIRSHGVTRFTEDNPAICAALRKLCPEVEIVEVPGVTAAPEQRPEPVISCAHDAVLALDSIRPNPQNPNTHTPEQLRRLGEILHANGWRRALTISRRSGLLTKGHGRLEAARLAGCKFAPVQFHDYESAAQELQVIVADKRAFEKGETDDQKTVALLNKLKASGAERVTGYTEDEARRILDRMTGAQAAAPRPGDPSPPAAPKADRRTLSLHYMQGAYEEFNRLTQAEMKASGHTSQSQAVLTALEDEAAQ